jgi:DNA-binding transcriptional LysR family regulator
VEIRQVRYFVAVAEEGNFGLAAQRLNISQPPITRQIQKLEEELGVQLFRRTSKGTDLTEAGRVFYEDAKSILAGIERGVERSRAAQGGELGSIEVGYFGSVAYSVVPKILHRFRKANPRVNLSLRRMGKQEQVNALLEGSLHVGFGRFYSPEPGLAIEEVDAEGVALCIPVDALSGDNHGERDWREIVQSMPLVLFPAAGRPNFADETLGLLKTEGVTPNVANVAEDGRAALMQVAIGTGACIVPTSMVDMNWYGINVIRPSDLAVRCPVSIVYRHSDTSPLLRRFIKSIRELESESE